MTRYDLKKHITANRLGGLSFDHKNLRDTDADGLVAKSVSFRNADLRGANFSEGHFTDTAFTGADLTGACLAASRFTNCDFTGALFGATIIEGATFENCRFSSLSALTLPFWEAALIRECLFGTHVFNRPPLVLLGMNQPLARFDLSWLRGLDVFEVTAPAAAPVPAIEIAT